MIRMLLSGAMCAVFLLVSACGDSDPGTSSPEIESQEQTKEVLDTVSHDVASLIVAQFNQSKSDGVSQACSGGGTVSSDIGIGYGSVVFDGCDLGTLKISGTITVSVTVSGGSFRITISGQLNFSGALSGSLSFQDMILSTDGTNTCYSSEVTVGANQYSIDGTDASCPKVCSPKTSTKMNLKVTNNTAGAINLWWVNFDCGLNSYSPNGIKVGGSQQISSFEGHLWRVTDLAGNVLREFGMDEASQTETIQ
jgi:hypothetical protein